MSSLELVRLGTGLAGLAPLARLASGGLRRLTLSVAEEVARAADRHTLHTHTHTQQQRAPDDAMHEGQRSRARGSSGGSSGMGAAEEDAAPAGHSAGVVRAATPAGRTAGQALEAGSGSGSGSDTAAPAPLQPAEEPPQLSSLTSSFCCKLVARAACVLHAGVLHAQRMCHASRCGQPHAHAHAQQHLLSPRSGSEGGLELGTTGGASEAAASPGSSSPVADAHAPASHGPQQLYREAGGHGHTVQVVCADLSASEVEGLNVWLEAAEWGVRVSAEASAL